MKTAKKRTADSPAKHRRGAQAGKYTNSTRGRRPRPAAQSDDLLDQKENNPPPFGSSSTTADKCMHFAEKEKNMPIAKPHLQETLNPSAKIKLQLFPVDEGTCIRLEKDGYHPYLELTLSARKKISSVLKHLNCKWGCSSTVVGNPILFPYSTAKDLAGCRWTLNDTNISAGDVHAAVGSPSVFRLRYGWVSESETKSFEGISTSTPLEACLQPEGEGKVKGCNANLESAHFEGKQVEGTREEFQQSVATGATDVVVDYKLPSSGLVEPMALWDDGITNISIGGLLSEASFQGRFNNCNTKSSGNSGGLQPSQLVTDSFDAFISAQINCSQGPRLPSHGSSSSILDAEDTCHAFPIQKISTLGNDTRALSGSACSRNCSQEPVFKPFKYPNTTEVNIHSGLPQGSGCQGSETDLSLCSRVYNDESSLGLSGIKWTESLGPFDLGLSSSRKIVNGDSLSISRIFS